MLLTIAIILLILWALGFTLNIGAGLIHILLVIALIVFIYNMISSKRTV
ncbi:lmo0937 family membrane protein [Candidatus Saccharibacteria bacterium]|nr:lmo0937 family membrane protein [Candidatus Saccharibacteria bacterium]